MPKLVISTRSGIEYITLEFTEPKRSTEFTLQDKSKVKRIEISDEEAKLSIDAITKLYYKGAFTDTRPVRREEVEAQAKIEKSDMTTRLREIIKTSNQVGEVDNARRLYVKLTGKECDEKPLGLPA